MRSILEQAVLHHLNGDDDRATELFHQFIVGRSRQIHESIRLGEEIEEDEVNEQYFDDGDLAELEKNDSDILDGVDDDIAAAADEVEGELGLEDAEAEEVEAEAEAEEEIEADIEAGDEVAGDDIEAELADLRAQLNDILADVERLEDEVEGDEDAALAISDDADEEIEDREEEEEEDFDAMAESFVSDLEKVKVDTADGTDTAGKPVQQNRKVALPQRKTGDRVGGKPIVAKGANKKGFEREAAPKSATVKPMRNNIDKLTPVKK